MMKITLEIDMNNYQDTQALISALQELLRNVQKYKPEEITNTEILND